MAFITENQIIIFVSLALVIFSLSIYLGVLFNKVKKQKAYIEKETARAQAQLLKRELSILESIEIIAKGVIQDQCEVSEGCLRIKKLKDQLDYLSLELDLSVFDKMYSEIEQFDFLEARKALSNQERFNQDKKRFAIENEYQDRIKEASRPLLEYVKRRMISLNQ